MASDIARIMCNIESFFQSMSTNSVRVWYRLIQEDGQAFADTSEDKVIINAEADIADLRKAIREDNREILGGMVSAQLVVYANEAFFTKKQKLLADKLLCELNTSRVEPLLVLVPSRQDSISGSAVWRVCGSIVDAIRVKGVRSRMYRNADLFLGYYEEGKEAFYYHGNTLKIDVLFKTEENALRFDSQLRQESITTNSPMNSLDIKADVITVSNCHFGKRIYYGDYNPTEAESPQDTQSAITVRFSTFEETSDEFRFQRIEKLAVFGSHGKAESCHLLARYHCRKFPESYGQYDNDSNNRLAMSRDLHGWFDHLNTDIPLFYLKIISVSDTIVLEGRYKVTLAVVALNQESADMIFWRLIEGSTKTDDPLIMHTFVHVTNPIVFRKCLEWKEKENIKSWGDYNLMDSAIP